MMTNSQRPGVYSRYDITSGYTAATARAGAGVVAKTALSSEETVQEVHTLTSYAAACEVFPADGENGRMRGILKILFESGVGTVHAVDAGADYAGGLTLLEEIEGIGAVVCDCAGASDLEALRKSVNDSSEMQLERVGYCGIADPEAAAKAAGDINDPRVVLCCPGALPRGVETDPHGVYCAAAVAGLVLATDDAAKNFSGETLRTVESPGKLPEKTIQGLLTAGVTVTEQVGGVTQLIRAVTTATMTGGVPDRSMTGLNTILIIDDILVAVRASLKALLRGGRIAAHSLDSVMSQVTVVLSGKEDEGFIQGFQVPKVYTHPSDPGICVVELAFQVAHVLNQIHVTAHIQV